MSEAIYLITGGPTETFFTLKKVTESRMILFLQSLTGLSHFLSE